MRLRLWPLVCAFYCISLSGMGKEPLPPFVLSPNEKQNQLKITPEIMKKVLSFFVNFASTPIVSKASTPIVSKESDVLACLMERGGFGNGGTVDNAFNRLMQTKGEKSECKFDKDGVLWPAMKLLLADLVNKSKGEENSGVKQKKKKGFDNLRVKIENAKTVSYSGILQIIFNCTQVVEANKDQEDIDLLKKYFEKRNKITGEMDRAFKAIAGEIEIFPYALKHYLLNPMAPTSDEQKVVDALIKRMVKTLCAEHVAKINDLVRRVKRFYEICSILNVKLLSHYERYIGEFVALSDNKFAEFNQAIEKYKKARASALEALKEDGLSKQDVTAYLKRKRERHDNEERKLRWVEERNQCRGEDKNVQAEVKKRNELFEEDMKKDAETLETYVEADLAGCIKNNEITEEDLFNVFNKYSIAGRRCNDKRKSLLQLLRNLTADLDENKRKSVSNDSDERDEDQKYNDLPTATLVFPIDDFVGTVDLNGSPLTPQPEPTQQKINARSRSSSNGLPYERQSATINAVLAKQFVEKK